MAYTVYSFMELMEDTGLFGVFLRWTHANTESIRPHLPRVSTRPRAGVRSGSSESAKAQILTSLFLSYESMFDRISRLANNEMYYRRQVPVRKVVDAVLKVDLDDVPGCRQRLLDPRRYSLVTLGPLREVRGRG
ncbi:MAG: hypothetical protein R3E12_08350 [Candidatus Eisenbacteria bacterium]